jgi:hypothetical protein
VQLRAYDSQLQRRSAAFAQSRTGTDAAVAAAALGHGSCVGRGSLEACTGVWACGAGAWLLGVRPEPDSWRCWTVSDQQLPARPAKTIAGWDTMLSGIPCRVGYHAKWEPCQVRIPCLVGYRAKWDALPLACPDPKPTATSARVPCMLSAARRSRRVPWATTADHAVGYAVGCAVGCAVPVKPAPDW